MDLPPSYPIYFISNIILTIKRGVSIRVLKKCFPQKYWGWFLSVPLVRLPFPISGSNLTAYFVIVILWYLFLIYWGWLRDISCYLEKCFHFPNIGSVPVAVHTKLFSIKFSHGMGVFYLVFCFWEMLKNWKMF